MGNQTIQYTSSSSSSSQFSISKITKQSLSNFQHFYRHKFGLCLAHVACVFFWRHLILHSAHRWTTSVCILILNSLPIGQACNLQVKMAPNGTVLWLSYVSIATCVYSNQSSVWKIWHASDNSLEKHDASRPLFSI